jgi:hypothetical protein
LREAVARKSSKAGAKVDSKLVKLEREIGGVADQIYGKTGAAAAFAKARAAAARLRRQTLEALKAVQVFFKARAPAIAQSGRKTLGTAIHGAKPIRKAPTPRPRQSIFSKRDQRGNRGLLDSLLVAACFGLLAICGILLLALFLQVKDMQGQIDRSRSSLSDTEAQLSQLESTVQNLTQERAAQTAAHPAAPPQPALALSKDEKATIRQFIRVLPPAPGGQPKIRIGDAVPNVASAPIPDALVEQMPKLRGARFLIDRDGAIVLLGEGSNRADAIVSPR